MASGTTRYPLLIDTDALIAVTNSSLWPQVTEHVRLMTTNVCKQELERHVENTRPREADRTGFITEAVPRSMPLRTMGRRLRR